MILVSGATGNVGKHLVEQLLNQGVQVRVFIRDEAKAAHLRDDVERAVGDLDRPETLATAMAGIDRLYFVTPETQQVKNLLEAAREAGVKHVVKQSTIEAGRSLGPGKWHREQEELIEGSGLAWTFLRPTFMMTNTIEWWAATIRTHGTVYFPGGKGAVPAVAPRDVAAVATAVLTHPDQHTGRIYELTGPEALTLDEMIETIGEVLEQNLRYVKVPKFLAARWMRFSGLPGYVVDGLFETFAAAFRRGEYASVSNAVERVGGVISLSFAAWIQEHIADFQ